MHTREKVVGTRTVRPFLDVENVIVNYLHKNPKFNSYSKGEHCELFPTFLFVTRSDKIRRKSQCSIQRSPYF